MILIIGEQFETISNSVKFYDVAAVNRACGHIKTNIEQYKRFPDPEKLLQEAQAEMEKDYALIRVLRTLSRRLLIDPIKKV